MIMSHRVARKCVEYRSSFLIGWGSRFLNNFKNFNHVINHKIKNTKLFATNMMKKYEFH